MGVFPGGTKSTLSLNRAHFLRDNGKRCHCYKEIIAVPITLCLRSRYTFFTELALTFYQLADLFSPSFISGDLR